MIKTKGLRKTYHMGGTDIHALDGVDLQIPQGQFVAICGASGSGKTTLMNMLGGLDQPGGGSVEIGGHDIAQLSHNALARFRNEVVGFVFQHFNLLARRTALSNVLLPLEYRRPRLADRKSRAVRALNDVSLSDRMAHRPAQLSGGQQQRVAIARALVGGPRLLLADEPTGALDSQTSAELLELLVRLSKQGLTIVLITHDQDVAAYAGRVITMSDGKIISDEVNTKMGLAV